jgi:hypothetical protein
MKSPNWLVSLKAIVLCFSAVMLSGCAASGTSLFSPSQEPATYTQSGRHSEASSEVPSDGRATPSNLRKVQADSFFGPAPFLERNRLEIINLAFMLDPEGHARGIYSKRKGHTNSLREWRDLTVDEQYEFSFEAFYTYNDPRSSQQQRRNRLQDRLLITADQRCGIYKKLLFQNQADSNFYFGTASTIAGALGGLFGERGAKNLAAAAGLFSGVRAEYGQSYFQNLTAQVVVKGIEERLKAILWRIKDAQQTATIELYTVQAAVKDAVFYDSQCSIVAGLEEAQDAIRLAADPGLDTVNRIIAKSKLTNQLHTETDPVKSAAIVAAVKAMEGSAVINAHRFTNIGMNTSVAAGVNGLNTQDVLDINYFDRATNIIKDMETALIVEGNNNIKDRSFNPDPGKDKEGKANKTAHEVLRASIPSSQLAMYQKRGLALIAQKEVHTATNNAAATKARKALATAILEAQIVVDTFAIDLNELASKQAAFLLAAGSLPKESAPAAAQAAYEKAFKQ